MPRGQGTPWQRGIQVAGVWRCQCSALNAGRIENCSHCGKARTDCSCPVIDGVPVTGSSCQVHGLEAGRIE